MTPEFAVEIIKQLVFQAVTLAAPLLLAAMAVGLAISVFQAVTSIHEQTLSFVPKALVVLAVMVVLLPWALRTLVEFTRAVIEKLPQMTG
ncbi:MAG TPA: flagellar biosynthesis protein FliQ [Candidatus Limnocylindria bacterium]|jgi:flagellar biosynthetic protein FliQ|nr:flagellar biosynthesis protein FliQ [Candidatus Limnocylindria bacterium]